MVPRESPIVLDGHHNPFILLPFIKFMRDIYHHVSVLIVRPHSSGEFLIGIYDNTYPLQPFRGRVNFFGGNQHPEDQSPLELLQREINEEFVINKIREKELESSIHKTSGKGQGAQVPNAFAPLQHIASLRDSFLKSCTPYKDFLISAPFRYVLGQEPRIWAIYSAFEGVIDDSLFEVSKDHLIHGRAIKSEGFATCVCIDDLLSGKMLSAGGTPVILADYLQKKIPDPYGLVGEVLGTPLFSLADYEKEFNYTNVKRKKS